MIDFTANQSSMGMWSWLSAESGAAPISNKALYDFLVYPFAFFEWTNTESGAAPVSPDGDDYIVRARRRGRR